MKNYLETYAPKSAAVSKHQEGGPVQDPAAGGQQGGGVQDMLMQVVQSQDPNMALEFCNMLAQQMGIGGQGEAPAQPGAAPMGRTGMTVKAPMFKKGGTL